MTPELTIAIAVLALSLAATSWACVALTILNNRGRRRATFVPNGHES